MVLYSDMEAHHVAEMSAAELEVIYPGFRQQIAQGIAEADAGKLSDGEEFFRDLEREERELDRQGRKTA